MARLELVTVEGGVEEGGYEYWVLTTPSDLDLPCDSFESHVLPDGINYHSAYVQCELIRELKLPLDANPRKPRPTNLVRGGIQVTLRERPDMFHHWNNGLTIICSSVEFDPDKGIASLQFLEGDGVCNGGHTYLAMENLPNNIHESAFVRVEFIELEQNITDRIERITDIASKRNNNNKLKDWTQAHYVGYFDRFKEGLGELSTMIRWFEGDPNAVHGAADVTHLIRLLASCDPMWYDHPQKGGRSTSHRTAARSTTSCHTKWYNAMAQDDDVNNQLTHMIPLMLDLLKSLEYVKIDLKHTNFSDIMSTRRWRARRFWQYAASKGDSELHFNDEGEDCYKCPPPFEVMIAGSFRKNVWISLDANAEINLIGWREDPSLLYENNKAPFVQSLDAIMDNQRGAVPSVGFVSDEGSYRNQLASFEWGRDDNIANITPSILYDIHTGTKYVPAKDDEQPTHELEVVRELERINVSFIQESTGDKERLQLIVIEE